MTPEATFYLGMFSGFILAMLIVLFVGAIYILCILGKY